MAPPYRLGLSCQVKRLLSRKSAEITEVSTTQGRRKQVGSSAALFNQNQTGGQGRCVQGRTLEGVHGAKSPNAPRISHVRTLQTVLS